MTSTANTFGNIKWVLTSALTILTAAGSTFLSTQLSLASHEAKIVGVEQALVRHENNGTHMDIQRQIEQEKRMGRIEWTLESIQEDLTKLGASVVSKGHHQ